MEKARKRTNSFSYCLSRSDSCKSLVLEKDKDSDRESLIQRKKEAKEYYSKISKPVKTKSKKVSKKTKEEHPRDTASREVQTNIKILKGFGDLIDLDEEYQRLTTEFESKLLVKQAEIDKLKANLEEQKINNKSIITLFKIETQKIDLITQKISNFVESQKSEEFENLPSNEKIKSLFLADCEELSLSDNSGDFSAKDKSSPDALSNEFDERCTNLHNKVNELINISKRNTSENLFIEQNLSDNKASSDHSSNICNYCEQEKKLSIDESPETCKNKQVVQLNPNPEEGNISDSDEVNLNTIKIKSQFKLFPWNLILFK